MTKQISVSDVTAFKYCRKQWDYSSFLRQYVRPKYPQISMRRGSAYHDVLMWLFQNINSDHSELHNKVKMYMNHHFVPDTDKEIDVAVEVIDLFNQYRQRHPLLSKITPGTIKSIESRQVVQMLLPDNKAVDFVYYCDLIAVIEGQKYIFDFKTTSRMMSESRADIRSMFDDQCSAYSMAEYIQSGYNQVPVFVWVYLNTRRLDKPKMLQKGKFSRAKSQYISMPKYIQSIKDSGQPIESYRTFIEDHTRRMSVRMFRVMPNKRPVVQLESYWKEVSRIAEEMIDPDVNIYTSPYSLCDTCPYQSACYIERIGGDPTAELDLIKIF